MSNTDIFSKLASSDYFFFYGEGNLDYKDECRSDFMQLLIQPNKSMFFNRQYGAGIKEYENYPSGLMMQIGIPFAISNSVAIRNTVVSDGSNGYPDRRIATSQNAIDFQQDQSGNIDISVYYYLYSDISQRMNLSLTTAGIL